MNSKSINGFTFFLINIDFFRRIIVTISIVKTILLRFKLLAVDRRRKVRSEEKFDQPFHCNKSCKLKGRVSVLDSKSWRSWIRILLKVFRFSLLTAHCPIIGNIVCNVRTQSGRRQYP